MHFTASHSLARISRRLRIRLAWLGLLAWLASPDAARAIDHFFYVEHPFDGSDLAPGDGVCAALLSDGVTVRCTLRAATEEAAAGAPGDQFLVEVPPLFTYALTQGALLLRGNVVLYAKPGPSPLLQQFGADGVLRVEGPANVQLRNLTLRGGEAVRGGGIRVVTNGAQTRLDLARVRLLDNHASQLGGGLFFDGGDILLWESDLDGNVADEQGGGVAGSGLFTFTATRSRITNNAAAFEGGGTFFDLAQSASLVRLVRVVFEGNDGGFLGGALSLAGDPTTSTGGTVRLVRSLVRENTTQSGGSAAAARDGARLDMTASTVSGNSGFGSTLEYFDAPGRLSFSTFSNNSATVSSIVTAFGGSFPRVLELDSSVMTSPGSAPDLDAFGTGIVSTGWNYVVRMADFANVTLGAHDVVGTASFPAPDPQLGPLQDNGGGTLSHAPALGGPLVDTASLVVPVDPDAATDQRGAIRCHDGNLDGFPECDRGAYEVAECEDLADNDGDGGIDFGGDVHCDSKADREPAQCSDGADNDDDEKIDYPADEGCTGPQDDNEGSCGLGFELAIALPLLRALRRRRARA